MERTPGLPGVRTRVIPFASSTPRPHERRVFDGPLLTSVPGGLPSFNHVSASLQMQPRGPPSPWDEASTLAHGVRVRLTGRPRVRSPLMTIVRVQRGAKPPDLVRFYFRHDPIRAFRNWRTAGRQPSRPGLYCRLYVRKDTRDHGAAN